MARREANRAVKIQPAPEIVSSNQYVLGVDVGGTKIDAQLFKVDGSTVSEVKAWPPEGTEWKTKKGVEAHVAQMADVIQEANGWVKSQGATLAGVGVGSPGRFDSEGKIKPGTNPHMGDPALEGEVPHQFDDVNLAERYTGALNNKGIFIRPVVGNDGSAMLAGQLEAIATGKVQLKDIDGNDIIPQTLAGKHIGLLGVGTGIGHSIMIANDTGKEFTSVTDGHASKIVLQVDKGKDWDLVQGVLDRGKTEVKVVDLENRKTTAEALFRGPIVDDMLGMDDSRKVDPAKLVGAEKEKYDQVVAFAGKYMGRLIKAINSGVNEDEEPGNGWTAADKAEAKKTGIYLIGGGMGGSNVGEDIMRHAKATLEAEGLNSIKLVQYAGANQAARAAATMVPASAYIDSPGVAAA